MLNSLIQCYFCLNYFKFVYFPKVPNNLEEIDKILNKFYAISRKKIDIYPIINLLAEKKMKNNIEKIELKLDQKETEKTQDVSIFLYIILIYSLFFDRQLQ